MKRKKKRRNKSWDWVKTWQPPPGRPYEMKGCQRLWLVYIDTITGPLSFTRSEYPVGYMRNTRYRDAMRRAPRAFHLKKNQAVHIEHVPYKDIKEIRKRQITAVWRGWDPSFAVHWAARMSDKARQPEWKLGKRPGSYRKPLPDKPKELDRVAAVTELPLGDDFSPSASAHRLIDRMLAENRK